MKGGRLAAFVEIDGGIGEGGGQVLRTTLSLSCITGKPVRIFNIRKNRPKPGLMRQHLVSVKALARISGAEARGTEPGSLEIFFNPGPVTAGEYFFEIGTAGSVTLLFQSLLPTLLFAKAPSRLVLTGGTHVPFSPPFDYLRDVFSPWLARIGVRVSCEIEQYGFYPRGGGKITARIAPAAEILGVDLRRKGAVLSVSGRSCVANLPLSIAVRQRKAAIDPLAAYSPIIDTATVPSPGKGTFLFIKVDTMAGSAGFSALGAIGKRAEDVGLEAARDALAYIESRAVLDPRLADQLVLFLALSKEPSTFTTSQVTNHLVTHLHVVRRMLGTRFEIEGGIGTPGTVRLTPGEDPAFLQFKRAGRSR
ncbi:MAG: RNA 3'-phosphate cyclase [Deltaproteobacteria bacterium]|nr:MAG: RNA 3'-phosphate cyclase [Deltaproteobacteria bacterium]